MARISDAKGRPDENSAYVRMMGNVQFGRLLSRVHATSIRAGNELEKLLCRDTPFLTSSDVLDPRSEKWAEDSVQVVFRVSFPHLPKRTGDFVILRHDEQRAYVVEVKDGDTFDTKKSSGELENLKAVAEFLQARTGYETTFHLCAFNQSSRAAIAAGSKHRFTDDQVMTGRELCELMGADYDAIVAERLAVQPENWNYLLSQMIEIPEVREWLRERL